MAFVVITSTAGEGTTGGGVPRPQTLAHRWEPVAKHLALRLCKGDLPSVWIGGALSREGHVVSDFHSGQ